jgi:OpgC protein
VAPYRIIHFALIAFFVVRFVPRDWKGLAAVCCRNCLRPAISVFCAGIFLSFAAHFVLVQISGALPMQILVMWSG